MIKQLRANEYQNRIRNLKYAVPQILREKAQTSSDTIHIVYVMAHVSVCGGTKIIFEHANNLKRWGARVTIVSHFVKPDWFPIEAEYLKVPFGIDAAQGIPDCDVIVSTYWDHIQACIDTGIAPVVYFEQGDFHLFDHAQIDEDTLETIQKLFKLPTYITTVSERSADYIKNVYSRDSVVFHNALDDEIFTLHGNSYKTNRPYLLMMGGEQQEFKGINDIIKAYSTLKDAGYELDLIWITPYEPARNYPEITRIFVSPSQTQIAELYRGAFVYVSGSHYESFSLPGLEAMACGCPLVTTDNVGVKEYAIDSVNSLFSRIGDSDDQAQKIKSLIENPDLYQHLRLNGLETAGKFKWNRIIPELLLFYKGIAKLEQNPNNEFDDWDISFREEQFAGRDDWEKFRKLLLNSISSEILVPVLYPLIEGHEIARWEIAAKRINQENSDDSGLKQIKCYTKVKGRDVQHLPYYQAYLYFTEGQYEAALNLFIKFYQETDSIGTQSVYVKWIVLCLIELQRDPQALDILNDMFKRSIDNSDLLYVYYLINLMSGKSKEDLTQIQTAISLLDDAVAYPEFFTNIEHRVYERNNNI